MEFDYLKLSLLYRNVMRRILAYIEKRGEQYFVKAPGSDIVARGDDKLEASRRYTKRVSDCVGSNTEAINDVVFSEEYDRLNRELDLPDGAFEALKVSVGIERDSVIDDMDSILVENVCEDGDPVRVEIYQITSEDLKDYRSECQNFRGWYLDGDANISQATARQMIKIVAEERASKLKAKYGIKEATATGA